MPIRCVCPNGHKLLVKDKLAGKSGVCPTCGSEFQVPASHDAPAQPVVAKSEEPPAAPSTTAPEPPPAQTAAPPEADPTQPAAITPPPSVEWMLASPDGQQYGPASPEVFAEWIAEGRVRHDWLVWRSDWADWKQAGEAAEELPAALPTSAPPPPTVSAKSRTSKPNQAPSADEAYAARRQRAAKRGRLIVIGLAIACLALAGMLVWFLFAA